MNTRYPNSELSNCTVYVFAGCDPTIDRKNRNINATRTATRIEKDALEHTVIHVLDHIVLGHWLKENLESIVMSTSGSLVISVMASVLFAIIGEELAHRFEGCLHHGPGKILQESIKRSLSGTMIEVSKSMRQKESHREVKYWPCRTDLMDLETRSGINKKMVLKPISNTENESISTWQQVSGYLRS